ncbi:MAG: BglI family type II restriction endonuclease [Burkholderiales bacterium]|nr:BglI family type II restriction endonuclease [Burkholderiales bacterium]
MERQPQELSLDEIEAIERAALRALWIAARDFAVDAWEYFRQSADKINYIAEDVTREMLDRLGGYSIPQRIYGNVAYRKARYVIHPDLAVRQALFVDSKAEKTRASATLQMSQLSMAVRHTRGGGDTDVAAGLAPIQVYRDLSYLTTTLLVHYHYREVDPQVVPPVHLPSSRYSLSAITLAAIPNGLLQERYNPDQSDTIWIAGRDAPSHGEDFRVRLSFNRLRQKAAWRVQEIIYDNRGVYTLGWRS